MWRYSILYCKEILWKTLYMKYRKSNTGTYKGEHPDGGGLAIFPRSVRTTIPELFEGRRQIHLTGPVLLCQSQHQVDQQLSSYFVSDPAVGCSNSVC